MPVKIEWHLPEGIVVEVLKRLPVFDVGRATCTSRVWSNALKAEEIRNKLTNDKPLELSKKAGAKDIVRLLEMRKGIEARDSKHLNRTPLHWATLQGHYHIVKSLVEAGANVNVRDADDWTPTVRAAHDGQLSILEVLISAGANVNVHTSLGNTVLMWAAREGQADVVRRLIRAGAKTNAQDRDGRTALSIAYEWGHHDVVKELTATGEHPSKEGEEEHAKPSALLKCKEPNGDSKKHCEEVSYKPQQLEHC